MLYFSAFLSLWVMYAKGGALTCAEMLFDL